MANGTIAFDTLQTSGQITGTAKSVDTDFVVNGSAKAWADFDGALSSGYIQGSLNYSSITDNAIGDYTSGYTNSFSDVNYVFSYTASQTESGDDASIIAVGIKITGALGSTSAETKTTSATQMYVRYLYNGGTGSTDQKESYNILYGDLA
jgi:hypothetical protein